MERLLWWLFFCWQWTHTFLALQSLLWWPGFRQMKHCPFIFFFSCCHSGILFALIAPVFALTVDTDISSSDFLRFERPGNREQCFSGSFTSFIFRCEPHASSSVFTVIFDATLSLSIFSVCDESMQLVSQKLLLSILDHLLCGRSGELSHLWVNLSW